MKRTVGYPPRGCPSSEVQRRLKYYSSAQRSRKQPSNQINVVLSTAAKPISFDTFINEVGDDRIGIFTPAFKGLSLLLDFICRQKCSERCFALSSNFRFRLYMLFDACDKLVYLSD
jgi:hypothetical protein